MKKTKKQSFMHNRTAINVYAILGMFLIMASGVSANLCDRALEEDLYGQKNLLMDMNDDEVLNIIDVGLFRQEMEDDDWCNERFESYFNELDKSKIPYVTGTGSFSKYNLDRRSEVTMSRNVFGAVSREIQFEGDRYKVGLLWEYVWLVDKDTNEKVDTPEGMDIKVIPRTFFTRTIVFNRE